MKTAAEPRVGAMQISGQHRVPSGASLRQRTYGIAFPRVKAFFRLLHAERSRITFPILFVALALLGGLFLCWLTLDNMLRKDAESKSSEWVYRLINRNTEVFNLFNGAAPSAQTTQFLNDISHIGDIYRFRIWNAKGDLAFQSERMPSERGPSEQTQVREAFVSGSIINEAHKGSLPQNVPFYVQSFIPVQRDGAVVGVFEVYRDRTEDEAFYKRSMILTEMIIGVLVLLAGGIPARAVYRQVVKLREAKAETLFVSKHDSLTGLSNRRMLDDLAHAAFSTASRHVRKNQVAALFIDMDRFKDINDGYGHSVGDKVLKTVAGRLMSNVADADSVVRFGGDEFVVLQVGMYQPNGASALAQRLIKALSEPYQVDGAEVACGASIGIAISHPDADNFEILISCADAALHKAKAIGKGTMRFFEPGMDADVRERQEIELELRRSGATNSFRLAYQPIHRLEDGELLGFEALLRWPEGLPAKSPAAFIPVAEESGLIIGLGAWALETACRTAADWPRPLKVAVNLSPVQFREGDLPWVVKRALSASGLEPGRLELEVNESLWIQDIDSVVAQLERLRKMGVSIALDDFGTGYSSLSYLWKFPFDTLKIDQSLVGKMETDAKAEAIVKTIASLRKTMGITITAEGVETPAQAAILRDAGCDQVQGFLFGEPVPAAATYKLLGTHQSTAVEQGKMHGPQKGLQASPAA